jgi:hypothetical protein
MAITSSQRFIESSVVSRVRRGNLTNVRDFPARRRHRSPILDPIPSHAAVRATPDSWYSPPHSPGTRDYQAMPIGQREGHLRPIHADRVGTKRFSKIECVGSPLRRVLSRATVLVKVKGYAVDRTRPVRPIKYRDHELLRFRRPKPPVLGRLQLTRRTCRKKLRSRVIGALTGWRVDFTILWTIISAFCHSIPLADYRASE